MTQDDPENRRLLTRRRTLQGAGALLSTTVACGDEGPMTGDGSGDGSSGEGSGSTGTIDPPDDGTTTSWSGTSGLDGTSTDEGSSSSEDSSTGPGQLPTTPEELLANIDHIIVLCMENRSFDHYLGALQLEEGVKDVDGLDGTETNPDQNGTPVGVFEMDNFEPVDPPHGWGACHAQWNGGANDGFVVEHFNSNGDAVKHEAMGYHVREHLPVTYALADAYTVCDAWFCSVLGPTWPNRWYLHCADSFGKDDNTPLFSSATSIQDVCDDHDISNMNYFDGLAAWRWGAMPLMGFSGTAGLEEFFDKLQVGGLESVVIIDPDFLTNDDHPAHNIQFGQTLIGTIYAALANSQYWERSLLIITYDEHGGFYDHVPPPTTVDDNGPEFAQMGFRVPTLVIGPHVRAGAIDHTVFEHPSFLATVAVRFGLPPLNARAAAAADVSSCIEPAFVDDPQPPIVLPMLRVRDSELLARVGDTTSQPELMEAVGIPMPLSPERRAQHRAIVERLLQTAERYGVIERERDLDLAAPEGEPDR
ncbi:alkaline phosphatase family protein [Paraliomyxa miuraensis]|uniref:alkaline phosphatase family protein n=1 Tax=Paraliomyxa miuraensis TaxID=376150 RepID=UPI00225AF3D6|nr:alkaline phosphatase family protein [Paraliomyxa miuraensis]MCX4240374.1 alkaline phosphatase family protein [Paraliomyxa miuraensis]